MHPPVFSAIKIFSFVKERLLNLYFKKYVFNYFNGTNRAKVRVCYL